MEENKEISALLHLIDDPDAEVYNVVTDKIISLGKGIIPALEHYWESVTEPETQERIEMLIHRLHLSDLTEDFAKWKAGTRDLLSGALLVAKYAYPDMDVSAVLKEVERLRRNTWLELNSYLTAVEQINVINSIVFSYSKLKGIETSYDSPDGFLINKVLESKKGNAYGNGVVYLILCGLLDVPVKAINLPRQFIMGFFDLQYDVMNPAGHSSEKIKFYVDPVNGQVYSHKDVENYFKKMSVPPVSSFFRPLTNTKLIQALLDELGKCFDTDTQRYKTEELRMLREGLDD